jgi:ligand-binding sensor domain-containing protein/two-component sensor histidine kinase
LKNWLFILPCFFSLQNLCGQSPYFKSYTVEDGMPFITVSAIFQDSLGNLWLGGYGGLSKFDGLEFTNYSIKDGLSSYDVTCLAGDDSGIIYVGTAKGINRFNTTPFSRLTITNTLEDKVVNCITKDSHGNVWIGTTSGLIELKHSGHAYYSYQNGLPSNIIVAVAEDHQGNLWIGTDKGLCSFDGKSFFPIGISDNNADLSIRAIVCDSNNEVFIATDQGLMKIDQKHSITDYTREDGLASNDVWSLLCDKKNNLWIGTSQGLSKFDGKIFTHYVTGQTVKSNDIKCLFQDAEENIWSGASAGLFRYHDDAFIHYDQPDGPADKMIYPIYKDRKGDLWIGTERDGLYKYSGNSFQQFTTRNGLSSNKINAIIENEDGSLLIGTDVGLNEIRENKFSKIADQHVGNRSIYCFFYDHKNHLWMGSDSGAIMYNGQNYHFYHLPGKIPGYQLWSIDEDKDGTLWFATYNGGLIRMGKKDTLEYSSQLGFESDSYLSVVVDNDNYIYFGAMGGVYAYDLNHPQKQSLHISQSQGLSSDLVYVMTLDQDQKNLWVGTNQGLNKIDLIHLKKTGLIKLETYGEQEGFVGVESNSNATCLDTAGSIWFGSLNGLLKYNPSDLRKNTMLSRTAITDFSLAYHDTVLQSGVQLNHLSNNITFSYTGICLTNPTKVLYKHKLEGFDRKWSPPSSERSANYSNLPPGKYSFRVLSRNNEGQWNLTPAIFNFTIQPAFWQTWWFKILAIVAIVAIVYSFYKLRLAQQIKLLRVRDRISRDLHDDIGSTLSSISYFSEFIKQQIPRTDYRIRPIADKMGESSRKMIESMNDIVWAINPKNDSFNLIMRRMNEYLHQVADIKNIKSTLNYNGELKGLSLPMEERKNFYLIFKEAVNNAVKYSSCSELDININRVNSSLMMAITDNGVGFDFENHKDGNGINNMKNRAREMNGELKIESHPDSGTAVSLKFNIP